LAFGYQKYLVAVDGNIGSTLGCAADFRWAVDVDRAIESHGALSPLDSADRATGRETWLFAIEVRVPTGSVNHLRRFNVKRYPRGRFATSNTTLAGWR